MNERSASAASFAPVSPKYAIVPHVLHAGA